MTVSAKAITQELSRRINPEQIRADGDISQDLRQAIVRALTPGSAPDCIVYPQTQTELSDIVACASEHRWRVLPCGRGTKLDWGGLGEPVDLIVSTEALNQQIDHAAGDLTITVAAGMPFARLQADLAAWGQFWPVDPAYAEGATIGGILATANAGSWRHRYGGLRDLCLGLSMVRADGQVAKAGGRVVKNVAGYDLMKLLVGSFGTLGIISEVTLRLYPLPPMSATVLLTGNPAEVATAAAALRRSTLTPTALNLLSSRMVAQLDRAGDLGLSIRFQGLPESVDQQVVRALEVGTTLGLDTTQFRGADEAALWQVLGTCPWSGPSAVVSNIGVLPSQAAQVLAEMETLARQQGVSLAGSIYVGSGLGVVQCLGEDQALLVVLQAIRSLCEHYQGFLSLLKAPIALKQQLDVWGYPGNALGLMQAIKHQFDPHQLLSPGRFVGGI